MQRCLKFKILMLQNWTPPTTTPPSPRAPPAGLFTSSPVPWFKGTFKRGDLLVTKDIVDPLPLSKTLCWCWVAHLVNSRKRGRKISSRPSLPTLHCCLNHHQSIDMMMMVPLSSFSPSGSSLPGFHLTSSSQRRAGGSSILVCSSLTTSPPPILHLLNPDTSHLAPSVHQNWPLEILDLDSLHDLPVRRHGSLCNNISYEWSDMILG